MSGVWPGNWPPAECGDGFITHDEECEPPEAIDAGLLDPGADDAGGQTRDASAEPGDAGVATFAGDASVAHTHDAGDLAASSTDASSSSDAAVGVHVAARGSLTAEQQAALVAGARAEFCDRNVSSPLEPWLAYQTADADWIDCINSAPDCDAIVDCPPGNPARGQCFDGDQALQEAHCQGTAVSDCGGTEYRYDCASIALGCDPSIPSACTKDPPDCDTRGRVCQGNVLVDCNGRGLRLELDCGNLFGSQCVERSEVSAACVRP
jgi:hypothetical protein